jgi:hypothetical protein
MNRISSSSSNHLIIHTQTYQRNKWTFVLSDYLKNENKKIVEDLSEAAIRERMHKDKYI